jgi:hypothetical protein
MDFQLPHIVDNGHFRMELLEPLEPLIVLRNQQVAVRFDLFLPT